MKTFKNWLATIAALLFSITSHAHDFYQGGIYYNITSDTTVEVTYKGGHSENYSYEYINIPSTVKYNGKIYSITSIGDAAFAFCHNLTSVTIGNSVTSIGDDAFYNCDGLTSVTIGNSVESIGDEAFAFCYGLTSVTIPNSVKSIGQDAFLDCLIRKVINFSNLNIVKGSTDNGSIGYYADVVVNNAEFVDGYIWGTYENGYALWGYAGSETKLELPEKYKNQDYCIAPRAFEDCHSLTSISIPNTITNIEDNTFARCSALTSVSIPNSVTNIGNYAFIGCSSLTSLTIPNGVTGIGNSAFKGCSAMMSLTISNTVTSIGENAFSGCTTLNTIIVDENNKQYDSRNNCNCIIETNSNTLIYGCKYSKIPNSVTRIGDDAFRNCSGLTSITIPNSVTSIGAGAFYGCSGLTSIIIPNSITSIENAAFSGCTSLIKVFNCSKLNITRGGENYGHIGYYANTVVNNAELNNDFVFALNGDVYALYVYIGNDSELALPENHKGQNYNIASNAFRNYSNLTSITIPNGVIGIGEYAFAECSNLQSINIGTGVTDIAKYAFYKCSSLTSANIPNEVTNINEYTFADCLNLKSINLGSKVTGIGKNAFYNCSSLTSVNIPNAVTRIEEYTFYNCCGLTSAAIPNSVVSIGQYAFYNCSELTSINIPNSVTRIESFAFANCERVSSVTIPNNINSIGDHVFYSCSGLTSISVLNNIIGDYQFCECDALTSVYIPDCVTSIGEGAFKNCDRLGSVTLGENIESINNNAFSSCGNLTSLTITGRLNTIKYLGNNIIANTRLQTIIVKSKSASNIVASYLDMIFSLNIYNHTQVYVPEGSYWDFAFSGWGKFIRIKEMAMNAEELDTHQAYMIADASGRNYSVYDTSKRKLVNVGYTHALDENSNGTCWTVIKEGKDSYLYNIGADKFGVVSEDGSLTLSDTPVNMDIHNTDNGISINGNSRMFVLNNNVSFDEANIGIYTLNVSSVGYATAYLYYNAEIPENVEAYIATEVVDNRVKLKKVEGILPANTGVIIKAAEGNYTFNKSYETPITIENNILKGTIEKTEITAESNFSYFVLSAPGGAIGMYLAQLKENKFWNNACKVYLPISNGDLGIFDDEVDSSVEQLSRRLVFDFGDETSIDELKTENANVKTAVYDLSGRRMQKAQKGIYIQNGKLMVK